MLNAFKCFLLLALISPASYGSDFKQQDDSQALRAEVARLQQENRALSERVDTLINGVSKRLGALEYKTRNVHSDLRGTRMLADDAKTVIHIRNDYQDVFIERK